MRRAAAILVVLTALGCLGPAAAAQPAQPESRPVGDAAEPDLTWTWPLAGAAADGVTRAFDPPASRYGAGHRGVDLRGAPGVAVLAAGRGRVSWAGVLAGRGVVVVTHGDLRTTYEPVTAVLPVGALVATGQQIGSLEPGHAGCPTAACLHWGLKRGEEYLDPLSLVAAGPVRLLPLGPSRGRPPASVPVAQSDDASAPSRAPPEGAGPQDEAAAPAVGWSRASAASRPTALLVLALLTGAVLLRPGGRPQRRRAGG